jgi:hypothetical protein
MKTLSDIWTGIQSLPWILLTLSIPHFLCGQPDELKIYPATYDSMPRIESPSNLNDSMEIILVKTKKNQYGLLPVTVENGKPLMYSYKLGTYMGKDQQLMVDAGDFPFLARSGLHDEDELNNIALITGIPVETINCTARPGAYSRSGFMAVNEDLISVLKHDNHTVFKLGLTHPELAKPLFHVWNLILKEYELGNWGRFYDNIIQIYYNHKLLDFQASSSKGWQISIFHDEIHGRHNIHISRALTVSEEKYLDEKYGHLAPEALKALKLRLCQLHFSEMIPFYIMRYGFYEGHTDYRCDPVSIAFIFGLENLSGINDKLGGRLYQALFEHFYPETR